MKSLLLFGICLLPWLINLPATLLEKEARGDKSGVSISPIVLIFPILGWLAGLGLNLLKENLGFYIIGGIHVAIFALLSGSIINRAIKLKRKSSGKTKTPLKKDINSQPKKVEPWRVGSTITGLLIVGLGVWMAIATSVESGKALHSSTWPSVEGEIIFSSTEMDMSGDVATYFPYVRYAYTVQEQRYEGHFISFAGYNGSFFRKNAQRKADEYPVGSGVAVYFDPDDPSWSVLEPGHSWIAIIAMPVALLALIIFGVILTVAGIRGV